MATDTATVILSDAIAARATTRDTEAFLALYDRYFPHVYTYLRQRCADSQTCDDLTAQTFEQALDHFADYCPERGSFAAWLFAIARNVANDHLRKSLRFRWIPIEALHSAAGDGPAPEEAVIHRDAQQALLRSVPVAQRRGLRYIQELAPRQRDLLALKFTGGLTNRQIATLTGLSEQNVAVILHRSIAYLRKRLQPAEAEHGQ